MVTVGANTYFIKLEDERRVKVVSLCVCVCRSNGYVYTYRLHKDDAGSWAAEVRLFIYLNLFFPPFALIVR